MEIKKTVVGDDVFEEVEFEKFPEVTPEGIPEGAKPLRVVMSKPRDAEGKQRDQTGQAASHMRYAATLGLPVLVNKDPLPLGCRAIIVGGGPSIESELPKIRALAADPRNMIFAINWAHTWLLQHGVTPDACVMFEIDADPCQILENAHPKVTYYICSHCHKQTFEALKDHRRVLWHSSPNSEVEKDTFQELFDGQLWVGGGISTFLRSISIALALGYRNFEVFGCDSSFPVDATSTHVGGYPAITTLQDAFEIHAHDVTTGTVKTFRTLSYLALQVEEFKQYCHMNHQLFKMRVHGDTLLSFVHRNMWSKWQGQYEVTDDDRILGLF